MWWREKLFDGLRALELTKTTLKNKKERESMNQEELDKKLKKQEILVKDEKVWSYTYEDHISSSLKRQKRKGLSIIYLVKGNLLILIKTFRTILKSNCIEL